MFHLIDSDNDVLDVNREIIALAGFESLTFDSPAAYLAYASSAAYTPATAIITCYRMPGMNGYELVTEVRKKYPHQKAAIISGSPSNDVPFEEEHLVCLHLSKPYHAKTLISALKTLNLCDRTCREGAFGQSCKYGLQHTCPFFIASCE